MNNEIRLTRPGHWPIITKAVLREDGIHFIEENGKERLEAEYKSIYELNKAMDKFGYDKFQIEKNENQERH